jgi:hypothetical protein
MNIRFLGDAFDHWKGSLLSSLLANDLLADLGIEPMLTDASAWTTQDIDSYRKLLRLSESIPIYHIDRTFKRPPGNYFDDIPTNGDLFLDPDTGVASQKASGRHIAVAEVSHLCRQSDGERRVLVVYQHQWQGKTMRRTLDALTPLILDRATGLHACVYECGSVAMLFFSCCVKRPAAIHRHFRETLGPHAAERVRMVA